MLDEILPNAFALPVSTPAVVPYPNLVHSTQFERNNFKPRKRAFVRVPSAQENEFALKKILKEYWGHESFRGPQLDICKGVMKGWDVLVVAPTGLGKSICFQVPAITLEYGVTLVASPLLALMKDQVSGLQQKGIKAAMLCDETDAEDVKEIKRQLSMGHPEIRLLYLTPETLFSKKYKDALVKAYRQKQIKRLVVDEAHIIDEWGMTFRTKYRELGNFRREFPDVPITALTASATEEVRSDITAILGIKKERLAQWVEPFNRKNLFYEVRYRGNVIEHKDKAQDIADFVISYRPEARVRNLENGVRTECVSGLVYCRSRLACEDVADALTRRGIRSKAFHAQLKRVVRNNLLEDWKNGKIECIVATIAFGMGVDQAHVRYVVHYDMPKSFEGYYQETGRAGRDGHVAFKASRCLLYYSREDAFRLRGLIQAEADQANSDKLRPAEVNQAKRRCIDSFKWLQLYAEATETCRHIAICRYFGEKMDERQADILQAYCGQMCDACANLPAVRRRATNISGDVDVASQPVKIAELVRVAPPVLLSDGPASNSLSRLHGSDAPVSAISSDPPELMRQVPPQQWPPSRVRTSANSVVTPPMSNERNKQPSRTSSNRGRCLADTVFPAPQAQESSQSFSPAQRLGIGSRAALASAAATPSHEVQRNASAGPSRTHDDLADGGTYAVVGAMPRDPKKRQRQEDVFRSVQPVYGEGPFGYYNTNDAGTGRSPLLRVTRASQPRSQFRTPFRTPFLKEREKIRVGAITGPDRKAALSRIRDNLKKSFREGEMADQVWTFWSRKEDGDLRKALLKDIGRDLESLIVQRCTTPGDLRTKTGELCQAIRLLRSPEGVDVIVTGELDEAFSGDQDAVLLKMVEGSVRRARRD